MRNLRRSLAGETGAAIAEYALLTGLIVGVAVAAAWGLGPPVAAMFHSGAAAFDGPAPAPPTGGTAPAAG